MVKHQVGSVGVVGAGIAGLSVAWYLQRAGVDVHVIDRSGVAAGASWGNAGWLTPPLATPLPEPSILRYGVRALVDPRSPLHVQPRPSATLMSFLWQFARNSTDQRWRSSMSMLGPLNAMALDAYDELRAGGVHTGDEGVDILAVAESQGQLDDLARELERAAAFGGAVDVEHVDGDTARGMEPQLSDFVGAGLRILGQRSLDPGPFCQALAADLEAHGAQVTSGVQIASIEDFSTGVRLADADGQSWRFDEVVVATGAWLGQLVHPFGVRLPVQSGRGYSFTLANRPTLGRPIYVPAQRAVCTPLATGTRITGAMELGSPDSRPRASRIDRIASSISPYLVDGVGERAHEWHGSRPCSADGLPLVGSTGSPRVHVHGGHGMWGMTQGPATAKLLAESILTQTVPPLLSAFGPLR